MRLLARMVDLFYWADFGRMSATNVWDTITASAEQAKRAIPKEA